MMLALPVLPDSLSAQASKQVSVTLTDFPVTLNGISIDNTYRQYPLFVYQGITYFPMTYYDNRFLGLETNWSPESGLVIDQTGVTAAYREGRGSAKNSKTLKAAVRTGEVKLNGKTVSADQGKYPFLSFRNITYFPLTWNYAVDEFGWAYAFDNKQGLVVHSSNPQVERLPVQGSTQYAYVVAGGYHYYQDEQGRILQAPIDQPKLTKELYQLPVWSYGDGKSYVKASLSYVEGIVTLTYYQGGATMGSEHVLELNAQAAFEEVDSGKFIIRKFGNTTIKADMWVPPEPGNLYVKEGDQDYRPVGDPAYLYGWNWTVENGSNGGSASSDPYLADGKIYVQAFLEGGDKNYSRVHSVDLTTNETTSVSDRRVQHCAVNGSFIYLVSEDKMYRIPLNGGPEEPMPMDGKISWIRAEGGYLICTFVKGDTTPYGMIVMNETGTVVFKTSDQVAGVSIRQDELIYMESASNNIYIAHLG